MSGFKGFNENTNQFLFELQFCNTIQNQNENLMKYKEYITEPIHLLYFDLLDIINQFDVDFETKPARCISTPYTDRRFSPTVPLKEYMYLRFRQAKKKTDMLGLYFDMGSEYYGYGLQIYKPTSAGMDVLREKISGDIKKFSELFDELTEKGFIIKGDSYKKDHFSEITECSAKNILNMKSFSVSKSKIVDETVYSENLKTELENAFLDLEELMEMLDD
ncbi:MAG: DUF2461 family protein [Eubacterium sp.]|nr:DUF2461 family protein [Eubacterium sp.]